MSAENTIGHNATRDDAVTMYHLGQFRVAKKDKASADGEYSSFLSRLESKGIDKAAAKEALKIVESGNAAEQLDYWAKVSCYCRLLGAPLESNQPDLFVTTPTEQTPEEKAAEQGFGSGVLGDGQDHCPHSFEQPLGQVWMNAWHEGCRVRHGLQGEEKAEASAEQPAAADDEPQADIEDDLDQGVELS